MPTDFLGDLVISFTGDSNESARHLAMLGTLRSTGVKQFSLSGVVKFSALILRGLLIGVRIGVAEFSFAGELRRANFAGEFLMFGDRMLTSFRGERGSRFGVIGRTGELIGKGTEEFSLSSERDFSRRRFEGELLQRPSCSFRITLFLGEGNGELFSSRTLTFDFEDLKLFLAGKSMVA